MQALAIDLQRAGIHILAFSKKFHVGELDTLARLVKTSLLKSEDPANSAGNAWWPARLLENRVEGISINTQTERRVDTVLASLIAALVAYGGHSPREAADAPIPAPNLHNIPPRWKYPGRRTRTANSSSIDSGWNFRLARNLLSCAARMFGAFPLQLFAIRSPSSPMPALTHPAAKHATSS